MQEQDFWRRQGTDKPLFGDLLWSRPEHKALAGKLLVIGGNAYGFAAPAEAYAEAGKAGIGVAQVLLPDALRHTVGRVIEAGDFAPSTPSGSFSQKALAEFLSRAAWADGVLLAGDLGRNSETAVLLEKFIEKYGGQLTITKDAADYVAASPQPAMRRPDTTLVLSFAQLQRIGMGMKFSRVFTFDMGLVRLVEALHELTMAYPVNIVVKHLDNILVATKGDVSSTKVADDRDFWRVKTAAHTSVWWLQNPSKPFEATTTGVYTVAKDTQ